MTHRRSRSITTTAAAVALLALLAPTGIVRAQQVPCPMCANGANMTWPLAVLNPSGITCAEMATQMAVSTGSICEQKKYFWRETCCGPNRPREILVSPTPAPAVAGAGAGSGPDPICDVCIGGGFPGNPAMVIDMLYLNVSDCVQYYEAGRQGMLPGYLCQALQFFANEPCGCSLDNGDGSGNAPPSGGVTNVRKNAYGGEKDSLKLSNQRGGAGGRYAGGRRGLKGKIRVQKRKETLEVS